MEYRLLVLPNKEKIDPAVLKKLAELIRAGATITGPKPTKAYGLTNYPINDSLVNTIAKRIWGNCNGKKIWEHKFGKGKIVCGKTPREILLDMGILPDFEYRSQSKDTKLDYIHRSVFGPTGHVEIYFVANLLNRWENVELTSWQFTLSRISVLHCHFVYLRWVQFLLFFEKESNRCTLRLCGEIQN